MKIVQGDLLNGTPGTIGNFQFDIGQIEGDFASPRHRHNFDQFRFQLEGTMNFDRNGWMGPGTCGYFPEGVLVLPDLAGLEAPAPTPVEAAE